MLGKKNSATIVDELAVVNKRLAKVNEPLVATDKGRDSTFLLVRLFCHEPPQKLTEKGNAC